MKTKINKNKKTIPNSLSKEIKSHTNKKNDRPSTPTRFIKCTFIKESIIWYQKQGIQILNLYGKGKEDYNVIY
jgi:hypothetical protein